MDRYEWLKDMRSSFVLILCILYPLCLLAITHESSKKCEKKLLESIPDARSLIYQYPPSISHSIPYSDIVKPQRKCISNDFKYGQWVPGAHNCGLQAKYKENICRYFSDVCPVNNHYHNTNSSFNNNQPPYYFSDWCWKPNDCVSEKFSIASFCAKLNHRSILVVGDSLSFEMYLSILGQFNLSFHNISKQNMPLTSPGSYLCHQVDPSSPSKIAYLRNNHLSVHSQGPYKLDAWNLSLPRAVVSHRDWQQATHNYQILLLNKGAHVIDPKVEDNFTIATGIFLKSFLQKNRNHRVYFRTTAQGHPKGSFFAPVNQSRHVFPSKTPFFTRHDTLSMADVQLFFQRYKWGRFLANDAKLLQTWRRLLPATQQFDVLHATEMSYFRPDTHRCQLHRHDANNNNQCAVETCDLLHHFLPSDVDNYLYVLHNILS